MENKKQLDLIGKKIIKKDDQMYQIIDFLNKNLKDRNIIFGLSLRDQDHMEITIYYS
ncbi:DUF4264 family protein [Garciella nitratireducens]|uniref:DUF4264 domain-containing protein n=1 Tax=Garciella nitratireducens DSM 15102 TaxID=1121911 RepID=A0A1T4JUX2_9FIRM|nr:DUF4264 family protein [Garciella nitratireducens]RBP45589.1 uncharacterized protein DUF4264 [Garciella nitratireducens]SJZ33966.1 Protein of unknown function [Garciella nitratireducens DSM 15102]